MFFIYYFNFLFQNNSSVPAQRQSSCKKQLRQDQDQQQSQLQEPQLKGQLQDPQEPQLTDQQYHLTPADQIPTVTATSPPGTTTADLAAAEEVMWYINLCTFVFLYYSCNLLG